MGFDHRVRLLARYGIELTFNPVVAFLASWRLVLPDTSRRGMHTLNVKIIRWICLNCRSLLFALANATRNKWRKAVIDVKIISVLSSHSLNILAPYVKSNDSESPPFRLSVDSSVGITWLYLEIPIISSIQFSLQILDSIRSSISEIILVTFPLHIKARRNDEQYSFVLSKFGSYLNNILQINPITTNRCGQALAIWAFMNALAGLLSNVLFIFERPVFTPRCGVFSSIQLDRILHSPPFVLLCQFLESRMRGKIWYCLPSSLVLQRQQFYTSTSH